MDPKKEKLLEKTYTSFIDLMLSPVGLLDLLDNIATEDVMGYGTTIDEKILDIKGLKDLAKLQQEQASGMKLNYSMTPVLQKIMDQGNAAVIVSEIKITIQNNADKIELDLRLSVIMEFLNGNWKVVHWHGSKPEYDSGGSDTWHKEEWQKKNEELQHLVDEKTSELTNKNRELEIEASLERVRSQTMAMHDSDGLLDVIQTIYEQLIQLNIPLNNVSFGTIVQDKDIKFWIAAKGMPNPAFFEIPNIDNPAPSRVREAQNEGKEFFADSLTSEENKIWLEHIFKHNDSIKLDKKDKEFIYNAEGFTRSTFILKEINLYVGNYYNKPYNDEENEIIGRFAKVFEQAYTRFLDLQKAEAQAREAQIEAALERVRATSMAMHRSEALVDVVRVLDKEIVELGIDVHSSQILTDFTNQEEGLNDWFAKDGYQFLEKFHVPYIKHPITENFIKALQKGIGFYTETYTKTEKNKYLREIFKSSDFKKISKEGKERTFNAPVLIRAVILSKNSILIFERLHRKEFTKAEEDIFKRFGKVFEQAYVRFLDLQKAEAQTREAQINLAVERVRAKALAMHKSEEIMEVVAKLKEEVMNLDIPDVVAATIFLKEGDDNVRMWDLSSLEKNNDGYQIPFDITFKLKKKDPHLYVKRVWENPENYFFEKQEAKDFKRLIDWLRENDLSEIADEVEAFIDETQLQCLHHAVKKLNNGKLVVDLLNFPSDEMENILTKMGAAFDLAYKRFEDLQKAEKQAREAQIEASLERVRAASMAMHKSEELVEVVNTLDREIIGLGININGSQIITDFANLKDGVNSWYAREDKKYLDKFHVPFSEHMWYKRFEQAIKQGLEFYTEMYSKAEKNKFCRWLYKNSDYNKLPKERQEFVYNTPGWVRAVVLSKNSQLVFQRFNLIEFSKEEEEIFKRFGKVFEQAYTRFLDLQKAEAQSREAQIEAALERVRAKSLAMHESQDLHGVVNLVYQQLESIGFFMNAVLLHELKDDQKDFHFWVAANGQVYPDQTHIPVTRNVFFTRFRQAQKNKESLYSLHMTKAQKDAWFTHYFNNSSHTDVPQDRQDFIFSCQAINLSTAMNKHTALTILRYDKIPYDKEQIEVIRRFAQVFEQSYTRFLDLQKAEAQARESEIQLALERVRSTAMAMHSSDELSHTIAVMFEQLNILGMNPINTYLVLYDLPNNQFSFRMTGKRGSELTEMMTFSFDKLPGFKPALKAWKSGAPVIEAEYLGENRKKWLDLIKPMNSKLSKGNRLSLNDFPNGVYSCSGRHEFGSLGILKEKKTIEEDKELLMRFAKEFNQTYTRFLDLQKAEAQAREALIEAALERVRAQTMAMHNSGDVGKSIVKMFAELTALGVDESTRFGIGILNHDNEYIQLWTAKKVGEEVNLHIGSLDMASHPLLKSARKAWKAQVPLHKYILEGEDLLKYYQMLNAAPDYKIQIPIEKLPEREFHYGFIFEHGFFYAFSHHEFSQEIINTIQRFSSLFAQTYRRYLDLVKAEAQAREAEIQLALERVRARTMAMHKSEELSDTASIMFHELKKLGLNSIRTGVCIFDFDQDTAELWLATEDGENTETQVLGKVSADMHPLYRYWIDAAARKDKTFQYKLSGKEIPEYYEIANSHLSLPKQTTFNKIEIYTGFLFHEGSINIISLNPLTEEECDIGYRFANVFGLLYRRFLDLQKAEAQAKEAEVQLALERVRARTMAMHKSEELPEAAHLLYEQFRRFCGDLIQMTILIANEKDRLFDCSVTDWTGGGKAIQSNFQLSFDEPALISHLYASWKKKEKSCVIKLEGKRLQQWIRHRNKSSGVPVPTEKRTVHSANFSKGCIAFSSSETKDQSIITLLERFAGVLDLTYTRFLDLQKAEAQAREALVEASLERVRSKAMAMHNSADLTSAAGVVFSELKKLGINTIRSGVGLLTKESRKVTLYSAASSDQGDNLPLVGWAMLENHPVLHEMYDKWLINEDYFPSLKGDILKSYYKQIKSNFVVPVHQEEDYEQHGYFICFTHGLFYGWSEKPFTEAEKNVLKRLASVVDLTFKRYFDLKSAEAQAREAKVEASLERVRAKAMAMHTSEAVGGAIASLFHELENLGVKPMRCGLLIISKNRTMQAWTTSTDGVDQAINISGVIDMTIHPLLQGCFEDWKSGKNLFQYKLEGQDAIDYYSALSQSPEYKLPIQSVPKGKHFGTVFLFEEGGLFSYTMDPISTDEQKLYQRFSNVFTLTYRRYQDLKAAELRAKEAVKQSSLDRVRGEIASMRTSKDLNRITPVIWRELQALEVPFFRCGVFIVNEEAEKVQVYLTTPKGKALGVLNLGLKANDLTKKIVEAWKKKRFYKTHWDKDEFINWTKSMMEMGQVKSAKTYQGSLTAPESLNLHFVPFKQGMLYVGNVSPLTDEKLELVKTLAESFSIAYSRYEDFKNLEEAKNKTEVTLSELKAAQNQLVQSEKMASLGELTAGIAHEIQNPLNFVNNFSEVSKELLEEMMEELKKGDTEEVEALANDIIENLEKINHHGKRADGIVKGMLQHSRTSSGVKEPTDINVLADEYLRLAYHGLRAKDKSFNAIMKTDFDKSIGKINVISQDIGRVVLNLITNAFYAVTEKNEQLKNKTSEEIYEPTVMVSTKKLANYVELHVKDNGNGIPKKLIDKIFQPFFTTKPTGSGTGLGLSLSYDIVKAHGGEIKVATKENEGTEFIIQIPVN